MNQRIIYKTDDGGVAVITPAPEVVAAHGIDAIAQKDVPTGKPYKIIDVSGIPTDRLFRAAWEIDPAELTDGVGAESNEFPGGVA